MTGEYLEEDYKFDTNMLIEPIRKASQVRQVVPIKTVLSPSDLEVDIYSVVDDFSIGVNLEPYDTPRSNQTLAKSTITVPVLQAQLNYTYDELTRINKSKLPMNKRIANLGIDFADKEDALAWAGSSTGVTDGGAIPFIQGGTAVTFNVDTDANTRSTLATQLGALVTTFGSLKKFPLIFAYNDAAFATMNGLSSGVGADESTFDYINRQMQLHGGLGSGIIHVPNLGAAVTLGSNGELAVTVEADECVALMVVSDAHFEVYASPIEARADPVSKLTGLDIKNVERWLPFVHKATSILYDLDATT